MVKFQELVAEKRVETYLKYPSVFSDAEEEAKIDPIKKKEDEYQLMRENMKKRFGTDITFDNFERGLHIPFKGIEF